jgi:hypothetical protein
MLGNGDEQLEFSARDTRWIDFMASNSLPELIFRDVDPLTSQLGLKFCRVIFFVMHVFIAIFIDFLDLDILMAGKKFKD